MTLQVSFYPKKKCECQKPWWVSSTQLLSFAETYPAMTGCCEVILHAVWKVGTWVTAGSFWGCWMKVLGGKGGESILENVGEHFFFF